MRFAKWLMERPEKVIAVVSHCDFLHAFFTNYGQSLDPSVRSPLLKASVIVCYVTWDHGSHALR
jgi:hypothetical protein